MKQYKALKAFSSPVFGNVNINDKITVDSGIGSRMVDAGYLEPIESKPEKKSEAKEEKPIKRKVKADK